MPERFHKRTRAEAVAPMWGAAMKETCSCCEGLIDGPFLVTVFTEHGEELEYRNKRFPVAEKSVIIYRHENCGKTRSYGKRIEDPDDKRTDLVDFSGDFVHDGVRVIVADGRFRMVMPV